jgi:hypothetical protein
VYSTLASYNSSIGKPQIRFVSQTCLPSKFCFNGNVPFFIVEPSPAVVDTLEETTPAPDNTEEAEEHVEDVHLPVDLVEDDEEEIDPTEHDDDLGSNHNQKQDLSKG